MIRTIIIDDEPSAVNVLSILLKRKWKDDIDIVATTNSPLEGIELIRKWCPDLVFLDIEMPGMSGLDLVRSVTELKFRVVFVTAYDDYAIEAFKLSAVNYILKPVGPEGLASTIEKIKNEIKRNDDDVHEPLKKLEEILNRKTNHAIEKIGIAMADKIVFLAVNEILYCEAQGGYTSIYLQHAPKVLSSKALGDFEIQLNPQQFYRIHHSWLINLNHIREYQRHEGGYVIMDNGVKLEVSQRKRKDFLQAISRFVV